MESRRSEWRWGVGGGVATAQEGPLTVLILYQVSEMDQPLSQESAAPTLPQGIFLLLGY